MLHQDGDAPLPHSFNVHSRCIIPYVEGLVLFARRHSITIDEELLREPHLGGKARCLHTRNLRGGPAGWWAGALLHALTHDFLAAWSTVVIAYCSNCTAVLYSCMRNAP